MMTEETSNTNPNKLCVECKVRDMFTYTQLCKRCYEKLRRKAKQMTSKLIFCACQCGTLIHERTTENKPTQYAKGHNLIGRKLSKATIDKIILNFKTPPNRIKTKPEIIIQKELEKLDVVIIPQKYFLIRDFGHPVDFFIPPHTVIEIDGEYFHTKIIDIEKNILPIQRDYIIDAELEKKGYKVLRFWSMDVYKHLPWIMNQITQTIGIKGSIVNDLVFCKCGCGEQRKRYDSIGVEREYIHHHNGKRKDYGTRECIGCFTNKTSIGITRNGIEYECWFTTVGGFLCKTCHYRGKYEKKKRK